MSIFIGSLLGVLALIVVLAVVVLVRTLMFKPPVSQQLPPIEVTPPTQDVLSRITKAISIPTVCGQRYADTDFAPFDEYIAFLQEAYPLFHQTTNLTRINTYALVYCWEGSDASLAPMMLTAHYDVVPVLAETAAEWEYPGFSGRIAAGRIWGRGTLDIKTQMLAQIEAAEELMRVGFTPKRSFYFVYGQDEEIGGFEGATRVAAWFEENGIQLEGVLDEGGIAVTGVIKGVAAPLALVGVAEKGMCNYKVRFLGAGGHSSMPPPHTALGVLSRFITKLEGKPLPTRLTAPAEEMLRNISGEMGFVVRMAVANLWLFRPILLGILSKSPATNAMVRTTFAATMSSASSAANVLPNVASATVNVRLLPGDTTDEVAAYFRKLAGDPNLSIEKPVFAEPSPISPSSSTAYDKIAAQISKVWPGIITTPYLVMGGTDSRKYYNVTPNVYRFTPMLVTNEEKDTMHNVNESTTVENYARMIVFFEGFIRDFDA